MWQRLHRLARQPWSALTLLVAAALAVYALLAPAEINGDGIGYLKQLAGTSSVAGHPAYLPLARWATAWLEGPPLGAVWPLRLLSLLAAGAGLFFFAGACRRLVPDGRWLLATALLAASHAWVRAAHEVEVYGLAVCAVSATLWALARLRDAPRLGWALLAGVSAAAATGLHITLGALALPLALLAARWSRPRHAAAAVAVHLGLSAVIVLAAGHSMGRHGALELAGWVLAADHGMPYPLRAWTPLVALWGLARSLVAAPYPQQATLAEVLAAGGAALVVLGLVAGLSLRRGPQRVVDGRWLLLTCVVPLALFGVLFFPSDTERWLFVLPVLGLWTARIRGRHAYLLALALLLLNTLQLLPAALDGETPRRARAAERLLRGGDLLVSPGHGWAESVGLGSRRPPLRYPLIYHVGEQRSLRAALDELDRRIAATFAAGHRVFAARLSDQRDHRGFKELAWFGLPRAGFAAHLARYCPRRTQVPDLWLLSASCRNERGPSRGAWSPP